MSSTVSCCRKKWRAIVKRRREWRETSDSKACSSPSSDASTRASSATWSFARSVALRRLSSLYVEPSKLGSRRRWAADAENAKSDCSANSATIETIQLLSCQVIPYPVDAFEGSAVTNIVYSICFTCETNSCGREHSVVEVSIG